jgi:hypothetical protein
MFVCLVLEARQPNGATYRLGLGCLVHPRLASMVAVLVRLL